MRALDGGPGSVEGPRFGWNPSLTGRGTYFVGPERLGEFHREEVMEGRCAFDYRLREGPSTSHNAIRFLELNGYPEAVPRRPGP